ncbi:fluoride efflux transporter CrcB [Glaciecola sp. MH2013]|uniref:fluoride efflux transporter CrcB n=1 Tax=Glaciecola sp. MH2013 TaxID=2785524 RepID=UPI00189EC6F0|nr:fluoride efflux transporter CrcB [Glaciecola sp. MH2013]MBF7072850.1 fluoride efflux transporter CrcB [Glaciecola sp. MH2013]
MQTLSLYLCVALGGALGASFRYFIVQITANLLGKGFPFGTLAVNVVGSFCLGAFYAYVEPSSNESNNLRAFIAIGLLGAFTTFSTFSFDTILLIQQGEILKAALNILFNVVICLLAVWSALLLFKG